VNATYDIFIHHPESGPIWVEAIQGLENARMRVINLLVTSPGDYFVYDPINAKVVVTTGGWPVTPLRRARPAAMIHLDSAH
jgi:hypothetical protein